MVFVYRNVVCAKVDATNNNNDKKRRVIVVVVNGEFDQSITYVVVLRSTMPFSNSSQSRLFKMDFTRCRRLSDADLGHDLSCAGRIPADLKQALGFDQSQINAVTTATSVGAWVSIPGGLFLDRFGFRLTGALLADVLLFTGYMLLSLAVVARPAHATRPASLRSSRSSPAKASASPT
jgi:MFS family permease